MDVPCPILETYLATIRPMDSTLSTELDRIGAARAEGQENQFRLSAPGIQRAELGASPFGRSGAGPVDPWAHTWSPRPRRLALLPQTKKFLGLSKNSIPSIRDFFEKGKKRANSDTSDEA
ncbi:hypothetical protein CNMCM6936_002627 [Aspergillus lentulus]|uniref:Uncharacterized protein n=1 Tax=Aspergillus lentulus TaxID=293939 RepID=A0AAN5YN90_ASPLE|nr:hypothetical protein CNMCM6936_002627 [Aspergillus lentulus]KAF4171888.1 hypothetical protein CNMCM8060_002274 [Aspergillus lentulus]KAF4191546.1 hypothetical protein CNMCM8694_001733 [Aspergillus lentulus]KAF4204759.1 hypothetical protein CNMCM8927_007028 [Aspergillus lentulus]